MGKSGGATCDGEFRTFASYEEAYQYYVNSIIPIKAIKGKYPNDPYSAIYYIQYGPTKHYASCSAADVANPEHPCYGKKAGDPTPGYVKDVSSIICGIQKWAESEGYPISSVTWRNYTGTSNPSKDSSDGRSGSNKVVDYCNPSRYDDDDNEEENDCEKKGTCDSYVFPLRGATKSNYMHGSALSPLPCNNLSQGGCHHDYFAMDLGLNTGTKTERDFPDLIGVFPDWYWKSVGVKVVAMAPGKIISYKPYGRATNGYRDRCASVQYETNDGRVFWLGHMSYDPKYKAGDTFRAGDVIGEVGPPPCAVGTQAHLHVDETIKNGSNGTVETVKLINYLYNQLP